MNAAMRMALGGNRKAGPTFVDAGTVAGGQPDSGSSAYSQAISAPASIVGGDLLLCLYGLDGNTNAYSGLASLGWTLDNSLYDGGHESGGGILHKTAATEPGSYAFTATGLNLWGIATILQYQGVTAIDATALANNDASGSPAVAPSLTASGNGELLICAFCSWVAGAISAPPGMTTRVASTNSGNLSIAVFEQSVGSGATGTRSAAVVAGSRWSAMSVLLK